MTLGEFRALTVDEPDEKELEVYIPYSFKGRGPHESGSIIKSLTHIATRAIDDTILLTTDPTTSKVFVEISKKQEKQNESFCDG